MGQLEQTLPALHLPTKTGPDFGETSPDSSETDLGFNHGWLPQSGASTTLLMLYGTGGDEDSLVSLGKTLKPGAP